jgi:DNA-binding CsgD family transcriptional regulator
MTHLLFLPDEHTLVLLTVGVDAVTLLSAIQAGQWQPPAPYQALLPDRSWQAVLVSGLILVTCAEPSPNSAEALAVTPTLPQRQREILQLMADGLTTKEIAKRLGISRRTVSMHIAALKKRLGVQTRAESVGRAVALGYCRLRRRSMPEH